MKELTKCFKLAKYSLQFKTSLLSAILFFIAAILFEVVGSLMNLLAGFYFGLSGIFIASIFMLAEVSGMVRSSSICKKTVTTAAGISLLIYYIPAFALFVIMRLTLTIPHVIAGTELLKPYTRIESYYMDILKTAVFMAVMMIYAAVSFRRYILSFALMLVFLLPYLYCSRITPVADFEFRLCRNMQAFAGNMFVPFLIAICYVIILAGVAAFMLISRLLHKYEIEPIVYRNAIRRAYSQR